MRWGVCATVAEPLPLLAAFAAHYAEMGASVIRLYLDRPVPGLATCLSRIDAVDIIEADESHYRRALEAPGKPDRLNRKQRLNANHAARTMDVDWLLHVDADEFLASDDFGAELAALPDEVDSLHIPNGERAWIAGAPNTTIFDGVLRWPVTGPRRRVRRLLGEEVMRYTNRGFCGHDWGKSCTRTGRGLKLGLHRPRSDPPAVVVTSERAKICHFDGLTRVHWVAKLRRYAELGMYSQPSGGRRFRYEQMRYVTEAGGQGDAAMAMHDLARVIPAEQAETLRDKGVIEPMPCDPAAATRRAFGDEVDLSPAAFDAALTVN